MTMDSGIIMGAVITRTADAARKVDLTAAHRAVQMEVFMVGRRADLMADPSGRAVDQVVAIPLHGGDIVLNPDNVSRVISVDRIIG